MKRILIAMRNLIESPERWTQGKPARDKYGAPISAQSEGAYSWCTLGALDKVTSDDLDSYIAARVYLTRFMGESIATFNDNHTHAEVLAAFDLAIASC